MLERPEIGVLGGVLACFDAQETASRTVAWDLLRAHQSRRLREDLLPC